MAEPTFQAVFGAGASQTPTAITINKADLPGLTASDNNTPESLLTGILLKALITLSKANFDANLDQSIYIELGFANFIFRGTGNDSYRVDQIIINLARPDTDAGIDPDNY